MAPTVASAYLTLFKRVENWDSTAATAVFVEQCVPNSQQNNHLVEQIVDDNMEFWSRQLDRETEQALRVREEWARQDRENREYDLSDLREMNN